jgi:YVTN family beta-propeller protein
MQRWLGWVLAGLLVLGPSAHGQEKSRFAGPTEKGYLLPNGWTIAPVGEHVRLPDMVLNILPMPDGRTVLASSSGYNEHQLALIDVAAKRIVEKQTVRQSWFGLAAGKDRVWWSGGGGGILHQYALADGKLSRTGPQEPERTRATKDKPPTFKTGLLFDVATDTLYSLDIDAGTISAIEASTGKEKQSRSLGGKPYDVKLARNRTRLYVSDWAGRVVLALDPADLRVVARVAVGEHPNQIAVHPKDDRLFVACSSSNCVSVIDARLGYVVETIVTALFPNAPEGSTPDAVALTPDGNTLFVANADNNCVAVVDVAVPRQSQVKGFIPTGWYPTALAVSPDGKNLYVGVGKGNQSGPNPFDRALARENAAKKLRQRPYPYIGTILAGALSIVPIPDDKQLAEYTASVYRNCPYSDKLLTGAPYAGKTVIPTKVGDPCPITHVIYIIKENRTYDQVFGDMERGNGDPSLVMFGEDVTPNHHKLAREFVLLDNLYCNGQVSRDGHPWSTMAYHTDYIARDWHLTYSGREGVDDDDERNLQKAPSGYLWDACARAGVSYRSYGEYGRRVSQPDGSFRIDGAVPGLVGHMCPEFGVPRDSRHRVRDTDRVETFLREFAEYEKADSLPRFIIMSLGEDHTFGTSPGQHTPQACVASNDLALARLVEAVSKSKYWPRIAIFVIEDDAQNGPDHVDAHRTVGLVISPYVKRKHLDSTQYATVSMIRTIELILGLPPLSQYDAAARPMFESFSDRPNLEPYAAVPARIDLEAVNAPLAYGADRSAKMDFSEYDRINDFELNEILWRAVKGADAPLPPAVRRAIAYRPFRQEP